MHRHELGRMEEGYLADLLLVGCDPLKDILMLQDNRRCAFIIKGGVRCMQEHSWYQAHARSLV